MKLSGASDGIGAGEVEFIGFPDHLKGRYQNYTQADISRLVQVGYRAPFMTVEEGISAYAKLLADMPTW